MLELALLTLLPLKMVLKLAQVGLIGRHVALVSLIPLRASLIQVLQMKPALQIVLFSAITAFTGEICTASLKTTGSADHSCSSYPVLLVSASPFLIMANQQESLAPYEQLLLALSLP